MREPERRTGRERHHDGSRPRRGETAARVRVHVDVVMPQPRIGRLVRDIGHAQHVRARRRRRHGDQPLTGGRGIRSPGASHQRDEHRHVGGGAVGDSEAGAVRVDAHAEGADGLDRGHTESLGASPSGVDSWRLPQTRSSFRHVSPVMPKHLVRASDPRHPTCRRPSDEAIDGSDTNPATRPKRRRNPHPAAGMPKDVLRGTSSRRFATLA